VNPVHKQLFFLGVGSICLLHDHSSINSNRTASALVDAVSLSEWITTLAVPVKA
jgi:hypothetical protein